MVRKLALPLLLCAAILLAPSRSIAITMARSPVGNAGNAADPLTHLGAVNYSYYIGTYDVTVPQYVAFLNSNDPTGADPLGLYVINMTEFGGLNYNASAANGSKYSVAAGYSNYPAVCMTWFDAIRFANWMDNGQPVSASEPTASDNATENGSYTIQGFTPTPINANTIARNTGATIVLMSQNEFYKAAYYNPATSSYFLYPTSSNVAPTDSVPTSVPNSSNYLPSPIPGTTPVGAYSGTTSPYGAYDMGGDVSQWSETLMNGTLRGDSGSSFGVFAADMESINQYDDIPTDFNRTMGFRLVAFSVPEPSSIVLAIAACVGAFALRKRFKSVIAALAEVLLASSRPAIVYNSGMAENPYQSPQQGEPPIKQPLAPTWRRSLSLLLTGLGGFGLVFCVVNLVIAIFDPLGAAVLQELAFPTLLCTSMLVAGICLRRPPRR